MNKKILDKIVWIIKEDGEFLSIENEIGLQHIEALSMIGKQIGLSLPKFGNLYDSMEKIINNGNILFLNHSKSKYLNEVTNTLETKYSGILLLPKILSDNQKQVLSDFKLEIEENYIFLPIYKITEDNKMENKNSTKSEQYIDILNNELLEEINKKY